MVGLNSGGRGIFRAEDCEEGGGGDGPVGVAEGADKFGGACGDGAVVGCRHGR